MKTEQVKNSSKVRKLAMDIIHNITEHKAYANLAVEKGLRDNSLNQIDKSLITEIVNGTVRMLKHLDWVLNLFLTKKVDKLNPWIKTILRMTLYQILFMDKIPAYACVNDAVELARKKTNPNLASLVNGVLRNIIRNVNDITYPPVGTEDFLAVFYSHPKWMVEAFVNNYDLVSCEKILAYNNQRPKLQLRTNNLKADRETVIDALLREGIECEASELSPLAININKLGVSLDQTAAYQKGFFYIQNEASMLAASILNLNSEEIIYDLCSGVGGKATHMAQLMNNRGYVHCYDIYPQKIALLEKNAKRLGIDIMVPHLEDVLQVTVEQAADKVLLDAPCSGLGVLNRRADLRWNKELTDIKNLTQLQEALLYKAGRIVKRGGYVLYVTCTINKAENEEIVFNFLTADNEFELISLDESLIYFPLTDEDRCLSRSGFLTIMPGKYQTDGMFYALLRRKGAI